MRFLQDAMIWILLMTGMLYSGVGLQLAMTLTGLPPEVLPVNRPFVGKMLLWAGGMDLLVAMVLIHTWKNR